ncbi:MAG: aminotransferase class V-fold PLP-dependent enzyme [Flavobacteriales bacterium]|nr:aminotransferase class V-fold PLP-dependent enzyme [Flavobacteriales bacterium]
MTDIRQQFLLNPEIIHLNHGSFGACPKPIFEDYQRWQLELEQNTVQFSARKGPELLRHSREVLGKFIGCDTDDVVYTMNPSYAMNIIAKSFPLQSGDEILATDLEYGAMDRTWRYYCAKAGAKYVQQHITLPATGKEQIVEEFFLGLTPQTKAIFISHITSTTALILPVEEICAKAKDLGLVTIVDGAHVPGQLPLDLTTLQADIYTGACHKWLLTPKGSSFLYVKRELQPWFDPLVISWGYESDSPSNSQFIDYHQLQGTRDLSAFLTIPKALEFRREFNWEHVCAEARKTSQKNYQRFAEMANGKMLCPVSDDFLGQMCSLEISCPDVVKLSSTLYDRYGIEVPVFQHWGKTYIRYSFQGYNTQEDLDRLFGALKELRETTDLLG